MFNRYDAPDHRRVLSTEACHMGTDAEGDNFALTFHDHDGTLQAVYAPLDDVIDCVALIMRQRREGKR